jgi:hypothetical protein
VSPFGDTTPVNFFVCPKEKSKQQKKLNKSANLFMKNLNIDALILRLHIVD